MTPGGAAGPSTPDANPSVAGGLTSEQVGQRAQATSYQAKAAEQNVTAAGARADQQWTNYLPRVSVLGRYTRLSDSLRRA